MNDTTIEMTAPYRSCEKHQDESWLEDCLHCQIESLQGELKSAKELCKQVDDWKSRAQTAEQALENSTDE